MSEILYICHRFPYPPNRGDKIRSWHTLKGLAALAPTHLATLVDDPADYQHLPVVQDVCASVMVEDRARSTVTAMAKALVTGQSASVTAFENAGLQRRIDHVLATRPISTIFVFSGQMAQFVPLRSDHRFVMDFCDVDSAKFLTYAAQGSGPSAFANRQEGRRLARFEHETARRAAVSLFVSEAEAALFRKETGLGPDRVRALENGIDLMRYDPAHRFAPVITGAGPLYVFTGQMDYRPNIDAVAAFAKYTLPLIRAASPDAQFAIVGRAPTDEVKALAILPGVIVTGEVDDTRDWLAAATAVVAPLKLARGIQNKILEAMAMAKPVIASPCAAEGIDAGMTDGLLVARTAPDEADACLALAENSARARALGAAARARMIARYGWDAQLAGLGALVFPRQIDLAA